LRLTRIENDYRDVSDRLASVSSDLKLKTYLLSQMHDSIASLTPLKSSRFATQIFDDESQFIKASVLEIESDIHCRAKEIALLKGWLDRIAEKLNAVAPLADTTDALGGEIMRVIHELIDWRAKIGDFFGRRRLSSIDELETHLSELERPISAFHSRGIEDPLLVYDDLERRNAILQSSLTKIADHLSLNEQLTQLSAEDLTSAIILALDDFSRKFSTDLQASELRFLDLQTSLVRLRGVCGATDDSADDISAIESALQRAIETDQGHRECLARLSRSSTELQRLRSVLRDQRRRLSAIQRSFHNLLALESTDVTAEVLSFHATSLDIWQRLSRPVTRDAATDCALPTLDRLASAKLQSICDQLGVDASDDVIEQLAALETHFQSLSPRARSGPASPKSPRSVKPASEQFPSTPFLSQLRRVCARYGNTKPIPPHPTEQVSCLERRFHEYEALVNSLRSIDPQFDDADLCRSFRGLSKHMERSASPIAHARSASPIAHARIDSMGVKLAILESAADKT
jgi:hypothetical protein